MLERLTITLPHELAETIKVAVAEGDYASASEVVRCVTGRPSARSARRNLRRRSSRISTRPWRKWRPDD